MIINQLLQLFTHLVMSFGELSITKCCFFYFHEEELDPRLLESKD